MIAIWNKLFYHPIYNALILIMSKITLGNVGFAVIVLTLLIKIILFPLSKKSIKSQILIKKLEPELKQIKKDYPNKQEQAQKTFALYKQYGVNPLSGCLPLFIQIPVIFGLYYAFYKGLALSNVPLYSFVNYPSDINTMFLGVDLYGRSIVFAILAGVTQFIQARMMLPKKKKAIKDDKNITSVDSEPKGFQDQLAESMNMNMKYVLPVFIGFVAYQISAAVALYWIVSNITTILQEWYVRRNIQSTFDVKEVK